MGRAIIDRMARYTVNDAAVARARRLIEARHYVLTSDWGEVQPQADDENAYLERHSWEDYASWHLGLTDGANDETKARHAFVFGDLRRIHRSSPPSNRPRTSIDSRTPCSATPATWSWAG